MQLYFVKNSQTDGGQATAAPYHNERIHYSVNSQKYHRCNQFHYSHIIGRTAKGGHATASFLEGFFEGSLKEVLLRRVLRGLLVRVSIETEVLRRVFRRGGCCRRRLEGA